MNKIKGVITLKLFKIFEIVSLDLDLNLNSNSGEKESEKETDQILNIALSKLSLPPKLIERLKRMGILTLGDLILKKEIDLVKVLSKLTLPLIQAKVLLALASLLKSRKKVS